MSNIILQSPTSSFLFVGPLLNCKGIPIPGTVVSRVKTLRALHQSHQKKKEDRMGVNKRPRQLDIALEEISREQGKKQRRRSTEGSKYI